MLIEPSHPSARDRVFHRRLALLILGSLLVFAAAVVLRLGLGATPYETADSLGRTMGFNDPLHAEHYGIIIRNFRPADFFRAEHAYEWLLLAMHGVGAALLLAGPRVSIRATRWFFAGQLLLFPFGLLLGWVAPLVFLSFLDGPVDREGFIDIPFIVVTAQAVWIGVSVILLFALRGPGLGLLHVWHALREACSVGGRVFARGLR